MGLIICCDGGEVTASYLVKNNIIPDHFIFTTDGLREELTYIQPETDTLLIIVSGLTEWSVSSVMSMIESLKKYEQSNGVKLNFKVLSNMPLTIAYDYYLFTGDLIAGEEAYVHYTPVGHKSPVASKKKVIDEFVGYRAKRCKYEPLKRGYMAVRRNDVDPSILKKNIFD